MPLPADLDQKIRNRFNTLVSDIQALLEETEPIRQRNRERVGAWQASRYSRGPGPTLERLNEEAFTTLSTSSINLLAKLSEYGCGTQTNTHIQEIQRLSGAADVSYLLAIIKGIRDDYLAGMLDCAEQPTSPRTTLVDQTNGANRLKLAASAIISVIFAVVALATIHLFDWRWILGHSNSIGIQASLGLLILLSSFGLFSPEYRKRAWGGSGAFAVLLVLFQLLGNGS